MTKSVLVVDDDPLIREMLSRVLREVGYHVFVAADADAAIEVLGTADIGVILVDKRMPGRDGEWLVAHAREHFPETAVVLATGEHVPSFASVHERIVGFLAKPFSAGTVRDAVADAMAWHQAASRRRPA